MQFLRYLVISCAVIAGLMGCAGQGVRPTPTIGPLENPTPANTLPELIQGLSSQYNTVQIVSAYALADMGDAAEPAVPYLIRNLSNQNTEVRISAITALGEIGSEEAVDPLIILLSDEFVHTRRAAALALGRIGDPSAVPALVLRLDDEDTFVSGMAARALERITGEDFPETEDEDVFVLDENGIPVEVTAAKEWWGKKGKHIDWSSK